MQVVSQHVDFSMSYWLSVNGKSVRGRLGKQIAYVRPALIDSIILERSRREDPEHSADVY